MSWLILSSSDQIAPKMIDYIAFRGIINWWTNQLFYELMIDSSQ